MEAKHTPGPWVVKVSKEEDADWALKWPTIVAENGYMVVGTEGLYGDKKTDIANAHLIAAAPELLEALKHCIDWLNAAGIDEDMPVQMQARSAIAKAQPQEGGEA